MNPLTKILVVMVVVLALLQTAATVVFVSRVGDSVTTVESLTRTNQSNETKIRDLQSQLDRSQADVGIVRAQAQGQVAAAQQQLLTVQQQLADRDVKLAQSASQNALQSSDITRLSEALKASEDTKAKQTDIIVELRKFNDDLGKRVADLNLTNADLTNRLDVAVREGRFLQEQNVELQAQAGRGAAPASNAAPGSSPAAPAPTGLAKNVPAINATVREVRTIANIPYATVSVGSADRVSRGMQFTVSDTQGNFLGFITIDTVEPNEAAGRLTGPRVTDIRPGVEARTQL